jgi:hypothetical protein
MENLKKSHEEELKNLTISVNGELLTREQIQQKIDDIDQTLYENSLKEYDLQKQINIELRERQKIEDQIQKNSIARNVVAGLSQINQASSPEQKRFAIEGAKQSLQLLGGQDATNLINLIDKNFENLMSSDQATFGAAMVDITGGLSPILGSLGTSINGLNIQIPNIQTALSAAVTTANVDLPNIFTGIGTQITNLINSIDIDPESKDNPFAKVYKAAKKVAAAIQAEFVAIKPKSKGGGSGGGPKDQPGDTENTTDFDSNEIKVGFDYKDPGEKIKFDRERLLSKSKTQVVDGRSIRITQYYSSAGYALPHLTKYEEIRSRRVSEKYDSPLMITGYDEIERPKGASKARPKQPMSGLPFKYASPSEEQKLSMQDKMAASRAKQFDQSGISIISLKGMIEMAMATEGQDPYSEIGRDIAQGILEGIIRGTIALDLSNLGTSLEDAVKDSVGAKSPATKMFPVGGFMAEGILKGAILWLASPVISLWNSLSSFFNKETGTEQGASTKTGSIGGNLISGLFNGVIAMLVPEQIRTFLSSGFNFLINGIKSLLGIDSENTVDNENSPRGMGKKSAGGILSGFVSGLLPENIMTFIRNPIATLLTTIGGLLGITDETMEKDGAPRSIGKKVVGFLLDGVGAMLGIENLSTKISEHFENFKTAISNFFFGEGGNKDSKSSWVYEVGKNAVNAIVSGFRSVDLGAAFRGAISAVKGSLPGPIQTVLTGLGWYYGGEVKKAFGGKINYRGSTESAPGMMFGGKMKKFATGSFVPGIGNTDTVPALLTPGEFVVRKSVAQAYGPLLQAINSDVFPKMNMTSMTPSISSNTGNSEVIYNYQVNVNVTGSNSNPEDIANVVLGKIKSMDARNIRGTRVG